MRITARDKKFLTGGGIIAVLVLGFYVATTAVPSRDELAREVEIKKRTLIRQREMLGQEQNYRNRLDQYRKRLDQDMQRLLAGDTPSMAGAELQRVLSDMAGQSGVEITRKNARPEQKLPDNLVKVSVQIETNCAPEQLVQFLTAIENYGKFLTVDELTITSYRIQKRYEIHPMITVAGYIAAPAAPKAPASGR
jgi:type II secretory pathway component PulM